MLLLQDNFKGLDFYNNADEMKKKSVFETVVFFSEREDARLDNVRDIGYVGSEGTIL